MHLFMRRCVVRCQQFTISSDVVGKNDFVYSYWIKSEWSPIRCVIIRIVTKSDDREAGLRFVNHVYDYRLTSDNTKITYQVIIKTTVFEKHKK